ncbi:unnamed protein product [Orchesella dallaii]|uniref:Uncharacterized protein n=1 Tax=Orchesella dallaii TaxID=48710 RepID=A0ABP1PIF8_9HEXA
MLWCFLIEELVHVLIKPTVSHPISIKNHLKPRFSIVLSSSKDLSTSFMNLSRTTGAAVHCIFLATECLINFTTCRTSCERKAYPNLTRAGEKTKEWRKCNSSQVENTGWDE